MKKVMILAGLLMMGTSLSACDIGGLNLGRDGKAVSSLSAEEKKQICEDAEEYYNEEIPPEEQKRAACTLAGVFAAAFSSPMTDEELRSACAMARDECINAPEMSGGEEDDSCQYENVSDSCEATLGEVEACYEDRIEATKQAFAELDCANLTLEDMEEMTDGDDTPESCKTLEEKCPTQSTTNNSTMNNTTMNNTSANNTASM